MSLVNLQRTFQALRTDLITDTGPKISTLRNYPFAILVYPPTFEFEMRQELGTLTAELKQAGWFLHTVNVKALVLERLEQFFSTEELARLIAFEEQVSKFDDPQAGFEAVYDNICKALEGPDGLAGLIAAEVDQLAEKSDKKERTVVFVGHLGAMYPFMRVSGLLKHLDGRTHGIPMVFLYPGSKKSGGLTFLDTAEPDSDYRPRIYTHETATG